MDKTYRVTEPYQTSFPDALVARAGTRLRYERKESEWEGWLWCTGSSGSSGWVPESWLSLDEGTCVLLRDYTAHELSVAEGEVITASLTESGWVFGAREDGEQGWIPLNHLSPASQEPTLYSLSDAEQAWMLGKLMLFWDGQWFLKTVDTFGLDAAIELNARVRTSFGRIEMRSLLKAVGKPAADDLADAVRLLATYAQVFMQDRLRAEFTALDDYHAEVVVRRCAAYEGAKRAALPRQDQACIACETLWNAWLDALLPDTACDVQYPMRQGKGDPFCQFLITQRAEEE